MTRLAMIAVAVSGVLLASGPAAGAAQAGDPDPGWTPPASTATLGAGLQDGSLVVVEGAHLRRFLPSGAVDTTFASVALPFAPTWIGADALSGGLVAVGTGQAARILRSGQLDPAFGSGGVVSTGAYSSQPYIDPSGNLLVESPGSPVSLERLGRDGAVDASFGPSSLAGFGAPGPVVAFGGGYAVAGNQCASGPCALKVATIGSRGAVQAVTAAASATFRPVAISDAWEATHGLLVVGAADEVMVHPADGALDQDFGQATCGSPAGVPVGDGDSLSLLPDGRTMDVGRDDDILTHAWVRSLGRVDGTFGDGGHVVVSPVGPSAWQVVAATASAVWFADGQTITKVLLSPPVAPVRSGLPVSLASRLIGSDGGLISVGPWLPGGTAPAFCGSAGALQLAAPAVGGASSPDGVGYWMVAGDGGVFSFGDARFFGSTGAMHLNAPVVGMAATPSGHGYWLVARDGGVFAFGDAGYFGSTGAMHLNAPVVAMAATTDGGGYWLLGADGGVFSFGDAAFLGSAAREVLRKPAVAMLRTASGRGYWIADQAGEVFTYGDAGDDLRMLGVPTASPVVGLALVSPGTFDIALADGSVFSSDGGGAIAQPVRPAAPIVGVIDAG